MVFFTCNHCPYVIGSDEETRKTAERFREKRFTFIGINSKSATTYPSDDFEYMVRRMEENKFPWVYVRDVSQQTASTTAPKETPHFFVFNAYDADQ